MRIIPVIACVTILTLIAPIGRSQAAHPTSPEPFLVAPAEKRPSYSSASCLAWEGAPGSDGAADNAAKAKQAAGTGIPLNIVTAARSGLSSPAGVQNEAGMMNDTAEPLDDPDDPPLNFLVSIAVADLAQRLNISEDAIEILEARNVVWPDAGLGCPQPGAVYAQIPVDGLLIRLGAGGRMYVYHSGGTREPFLCEATSRLVPRISPGVDEFVPPPGYEIE